MCGRRSLPGPILECLTLALSTGGARRHRLAIEAWCEARRNWRDAHGWPTDMVEFMREEVAVRIPGFYDRTR